jgi:hypothetical protein
VVGEANALVRPLSESLAEPPLINAVNRRGRNHRVAALDAQTMGQPGPTFPDPR